MCIGPPERPACKSRLTDGAATLLWNLSSSQQVIGCVGLGFARGSATGLHVAAVVCGWAGEGPYFIRASRTANCHGLCSRLNAYVEETGEASYALRSDVAELRDVIEREATERGPCRSTHGNTGALQRTQCSVC